jgi:hypothetical protein
MSQDMLFEVLHAADYMSIAPMLDLICLKLTVQVLGRSADFVRQFARRYVDSLACHRQRLSLALRTFCLALVWRWLHFCYGRQYLVALKFRDFLQIPELTPDERQDAREKHPWIFGKNSHS